MVGQSKGTAKKSRRAARLWVTSRASFPSFKAVYSPSPPCSKPCTRTSDFCLTKRKHDPALQRQRLATDSVCFVCTAVRQVWGANVF